ncbi:MAG: hypothetical protein FWE69_00800 [Clostridiales bacterium]|nr:hypothetical protein [Clostridiales bacterium]
MTLLFRTGKNSGPAVRRNGVDETEPPGACSANNEEIFMMEEEEEMVDLARLEAVKEWKM